MYVSIKYHVTMQESKRRHIGILYINNSYYFSEVYMFQSSIMLYLNKGDNGGNDLPWYLQMNVIETLLFSLPVLWEKMQYDV